MLARFKHCQSGLLATALALCPFAATAAEPLAAVTSEIEVGQVVRIVEFHDDGTRSVARALVSHVGKKNEGKYFALDVAVGGHFSAGLVIDCDGRCLGVIDSKNSDRRSIQCVARTNFEQVFSLP